MFMPYGNVDAKVWYSKKDKMNINQVSVKRTGNFQKKHEIIFNNFKINFNKSLPKFKKYDTIYEEKKIKLFSDFYLPITLGISTFYELKEEKLSLSVEEAEKILEEKLKKELSDEIKNKNSIKDVKVNKKEYGNSVEVEVTYEVIEQIGTEEKIVY